MSQKVTLREVREGAGKSLGECLKMEFRMVHHCCTGKTDFIQGVKALLIDKRGQARWDPASIKQVTALTQWSCQMLKDPVYSWCVSSYGTCAAFSSFQAIQSFPTKPGKTLKGCRKPLQHAWHRHMRTPKSLLSTQVTPEMVDAFFQEVPQGLELPPRTGRTLAKL